jgi:hypothetical protein
MNFDLSNEEMTLLDMLLSKEIGDTRVEIRRTERHDLKHDLKDREQLIVGLRERIVKALAGK